MPYQPGSGAGQVFISKALGTTAAAYDQSLDAFAWKAMFPRIDVLQTEGQYPEFPVGPWARLVAGPRGENEEVKTGGFKVNWKSYKTALFGVGSDLGQLSANNQEPVMKLKQRKAKWCTKQMNILLEQYWATNYFSSGSSWTTKLTGSATPSGATQFLKWTDPGSSPITIVNDTKAAVHKASGGFEPNMGALGYTAFQKLKTHPEIVDRIKHTSDESIHIEILQRYFELEKLVICKALVNTAAEDTADTTTMDYICGNNMLLAYVDGQPAISEDAPTAGATIWHTGMEGSINGLQVAEVNIPERRITRVEMQVGFQMHMIAANLGGLLVGVI